VNVSRNVKGRIGEFIASAAIEQRGWLSVAATVDHIDIVALKDGEVLRIQVKASTLRTGGGRRPQYIIQPFNRHPDSLNPARVDILAIVALDVRKVIFCDPASVAKCYRISPNKFNIVDIERTSWESAVSEVMLRKQQSPRQTPIAGATMLKGYKTYITAGLAVLAAVAAYLVGDATPVQAATLVFNALLAATVRHGIG